MWIAIPGVNHFPEKKGKMCYVIFAESSYLFKKSSEFVKSIKSYVLVIGRFNLEHTFCNIIVYVADFSYIIRGRQTSMTRFFNQEDNFVLLH